MRSRFCHVLLGLTVAIASRLAVAAAPAPLPALNEKVVAFARSQVGAKVGDGVCTTLAVEALARAGAKQYPLDRGDGDYVWGRRIESPKDANPGDVLQFRDAVFKGRQRYSGGRIVFWNQTYPHHTAIVAAVKLDGKVLTILHQNVGGQGVDEAGKKTVQESTLRMDSLQKGGSVRIYRPEEGP